MGVAFCRAGKSAEADAPFGRARDLLSTLADDYADEPAYRSSLAALLNNQALALAGAGRQNDALAIYPQAIEKQREASKRRPELASMQEVLSKLYYNYGQSLSAVGRWSDALDTAVARREVWQKNGERLVGVAAEMAQMADDRQGEASQSLTDSLRQKVNNEAIDTLYQARDCGWPQGIDLAADKRFAKLHTNERFAALVAELKSTSERLPKTAQAGRTTSSSTTN